MRYKFASAFVHSTNMHSEEWWVQRPLVREFKNLIRRISFADARVTFVVWLGAWCLLVLAVLFCAHAANSDLLRVEVAAEVRPAPGAEGVKLRVEQKAGYLAEPNHGLYYLIIVPLCFLLAWWSVGRCHRVLIDLAQEKILVPNEVREAAPLAAPEERSFEEARFRGFLRKLGRSNLRWFRWLPAIFFAAALLNNVIREVYSWTKPEVIGGTAKTFGYIQAPFFGRFRDNLEKAGAEQKLGQIKDMEMLRRSLEGEVRERLARHQNYFLAWVKAELVAIKNWPITAEVNSREAMGWEDTKVDVEKAVAKGFLHLNVAATGGTRESERLWFYLFFIGVMLIESFFHAFALWIAAKYLFWLVIVHRLLPSKGTYGWSLALYFEDSQKEFGLRDLHHTYNLVLYAILIGVFSMLLQSQNSLKNSTMRAFDPSSVVTVMIQLSVLGLGLALTIIAAYRNNKALKPEIDAVKKQALVKIRDAKNREDRAEYREELDLIEAQRPWPQENREFWRILAGALILLLLPLAGDSLKSIPFLPQLAEVTTAVGHWQNFVNWCVEKTTHKKTDNRAPTASNLEVGLLHVSYRLVEGKLQKFRTQGQFLKDDQPNIEISKNADGHALSVVEEWNSDQFLSRLVDPRMLPKLPVWKFGKCTGFPATVGGSRVDVCFGPSNAVGSISSRFAGSESTELMLSVKWIAMMGRR